MAEIVYKSLSSLSPIELKYQYHRNEELESSLSTYQEGYNFYEVDGLKGFQDVAINRNSCFVLTSAVNLSSIFTPTEQHTLGNLPGSILLQPRNSLIYYVSYRTKTDTFNLTLSTGSIFYISPVNENNEVELFVDNKYVQVNSNYPYVVYLSEKTLNPEEINRQRFNLVYQNGFITLRTKTNSGYRFLALNNDNTLRAVGVILNNSVINDYIFKCIPVTDPNLKRGFSPSNNWVTYYFDIEKSSDNKTVTVNKNIEDTRTNLLLDFTLEQAAETGTAIVNIANLKTGMTPSGGPAPVDNSYIKDVTTTNAPFQSLTHFTGSAIKTITQTVSLVVDGAGVTFSFDKFNPALGTLNSVTLSLSSSVDTGTFSVTNNNSTSISVKSPKDYLTVYDNQGSGADYNGANVILVTTPATGAVGYTLAGNSSQNFTVTPKSLIGATAVITDLSSFAADYTGTGNVTFDAIIAPNVTISGGSATIDMSTVINNTTLVLTYTYTVQY